MEDPSIPERYRHVLGHYPTGVSVVSAIDSSGQPTGMVVGTFTSVSLDPPLVAFLPDKSSTSWPKIREAGSFCVNVLSAEQDAVCRQVAKKGPDKFDNLTWSASPFSGSPLLDDVVAWIDCRLEQVFDSGDHYIAVGRVQGFDASESTAPLTFFRGGYGRLVSDPEEATAREDGGRPSSRSPESRRPTSRLQELAEAAGVPTEELYEQYSSEEAIAHDLIRDYLTALLAEYEQLATAASHTPVGTISALIGASFRSIDAHRAAIIVYQNVGARLVGKAAEDIRELDDRIELLWTTVIGDGIVSGHFRDDLEPRMVYRFIRDATFMAARWYRPTGRFGPHELADKYADLLLLGVVRRDRKV
jgi:flavin reductase (DIM6/NTAB) family NADH-FMN oxidoreductase RutF/AcrR family transcriptional regulator